MHHAFQRHIDACNNADLPGDRRVFRLAGTPVGWLAPDFARQLAAQPGVQARPDGCNLPIPAVLPELARGLAARGLYRFRDEAFDVRATPDGPVLGTIDRGALPSFGLMAEGVHLNGLVYREDGLHLWVGTRSRTKLLDPGKLDHLVAGGVSAGMTPGETLVKEGEEEAGLPPALALRADYVGTVSYAMERAEGLRRDVLHCYDLELPESFVPSAEDGEVESFALWPIERVFETVRDTDAFKFNVNLVLIDLFQRLGMLAD